MQKLEYEPFHTEPVQDYIRDNREYINNKASSFSYEIRPRKQIDNVSILNKYQEEIAKLKAKNTTLKNQNKILLEELQKTNKTQTNVQIQKLMSYLKVSSSEEILPKISSIMEQNNLKNEFISKLFSLYSEISGNPIPYTIEDNNIIELWRWIKEFIKTIKDLLAEKNEHDCLRKYQDQNNLYQEYCTELIKKYNLNSIFELKEFINSLLAKDTINKRRVEKLQKVLSS